MLGSVLEPFAQSKNEVRKKSNTASPSKLTTSPSELFNSNLEEGPFNQELQSSKAKSFQLEFIQTRSSSRNIETKLISKAGQDRLDTILEDMEKEVPLSEEYHYLNYVNSNYEISKIPELEKAYGIAADKTVYYDDFIAHFELTGNKSKKAEFCKLLYESGSISDGVLVYNFNVLMSIEKNGILFVNGSDDTYPIWMHQLNNIRTDITILNTDLLGVDSYRKSKMLELGLKETLNYNQDRMAYMKSIAKNNPKKPIYFGLTVSPTLIRELKADLYLTGLALKFSTSAIDNVPILQDNWENKFNTKTLHKEHQNSTARKMNMNYMLPLLSLSDIYEIQGNKSEAILIKNLALNLAKEGGKEKVVKKYIDKRE